MSPAESASALLASLPEGGSPTPWRVEWPAQDPDTWHEQYIGPCILYVNADGEDRIVTDLVRDLNGATVLPGMDPQDDADAALIAAAPSLRDALAAALDREAQLLTLLADAADIIAEHAPGHTVWLREASIATRSPHLGDSDAR